MKKLIILMFLATAYSCTTTKSVTRRHTVDACPMWADCIHNPENEEFIVEVAFNLGIKPEMVTQEMFNERYLN
jgi:hypothetical protein